MFDNIKLGHGWQNVHTAMASQGVESGDQLLITVLTAVERLHFGDAQPTDNDAGYVRIRQDDIIVTKEGVDCWVLGPAELQVEYAP